MGANVFTAAFVKYQTKYFGYSHPSETGHTGFVNGQPLVDCSQLVYDGLIGAGYVLPIAAKNFSTYTLFNGDAFTNDAASYFQSPIYGPDVLNPNALQMGDIICFRSNNPSYYKNGQPVYEQHMGIFLGYNNDGSPIFYGSQSKGPATDIIGAAGSYWNGGNETIVGALRPKDNIYNPQYDTTTTITYDVGFVNYWGRVRNVFPSHIP